MYNSIVVAHIGSSIRAQTMRSKPHTYMLLHFKRRTIRKFEMDHECHVIVHKITHLDIAFINKYGITCYLAQGKCFCAVCFKRSPLENITERLSNFTIGPNGLFDPRFNV